MARFRTPRSSGDPGYPNLEFKPEPQRARYTYLRDRMLLAGMTVETDPGNFTPLWMLGIEEDSILIQKSGSRPNAVGVHPDGRVSLVYGMDLAYPEEVAGQLTEAVILEWLDSRSQDISLSMLADRMLRIRNDPADPPKFMPKVEVPAPPGGKRSRLATVVAAREVTSFSSEEDDALLEETGMSADDQTGAAELVHVSVTLDEPLDFTTALVPWNDLGIVLQRSDPVDRVDFTLRLGILMTPSGFIGDGHVPPNENRVGHQLTHLAGEHRGHPIFALRSRPSSRISPDIGTGLDIDDALQSHYIGSGYSALFSKQFDYHRTPAGEAVILRQTLRHLLSGVMLGGLPAPTAPHRAGDLLHFLDGGDEGDDLQLGMWTTSGGLDHDYVRDALGMDPVRTTTRITLDLP